VLGLDSLDPSPSCLVTALESEWGMRRGREGRLRRKLTSDRWSENKEGLTIPSSIAMKRECCRGRDRGAEKGNQGQWEGLTTSEVDGG
jgi:hypothetical protein